MNTETITKITSTGIVGIFAIINGWLGWLILLYMTTMTIDWISGTFLAIKENRWSSSIARQGLWHKGGTLMSICVSILTDFLLNLIINNFPSIQLPFEYNVLLCPIVIIWYTVTELGSILENISAAGTPVPSFLTNALALIKKLCGTHHTE